MLLLLNYHAAMLNILYTLVWSSHLIKIYRLYTFLICVRLTQSVLFTRRSVLHLLLTPPPPPPPKKKKGKKETSVRIFFFFFFSFTMLFTVVEYFDTGALVEEKLWPTSFGSTEVPRYRLFTASDWLKRPVAQAHLDSLMVVMRRRFTLFVSS